MIMHLIIGSLAKYTNMSWLVYTDSIYTNCKDNNKVITNANNDNGDYNCNKMCITTNYNIKYDIKQ